MWFMMLLVLVYLGAVYALTAWAIHDAEARGKPGWAVACFCLPFPLGPVIWALLRPPKLPPSVARQPFNLERFRVQ